MDIGWIALAACLVVVFGAALPLLRDRDRTPLPPKKETLRDWRQGD